MFLRLFQEAVNPDVPLIPNDVPWYYISLAMLVGGAMLTHGVTMVTRGWEKELKLPDWFSVAGQGAGIALSTGMGCLAGHIVWHWALGGMVSLVGAFSSALVLSFVRARLGAVKDAAKDAVSEDPKP